MQLREYRGGDNNIEAQCRKFNRALDGKLTAQGIYYSYSTIDKNDFALINYLNGYRAFLISMYKKNSDIKIGKIINEIEEIVTYLQKT